METFGHDLDSLRLTIPHSTWELDDGGRTPPVAPSMYTFLESNTDSVSTRSVYDVGTHEGFDSSTGDVITHQGKIFNQAVEEDPTFRSLVHGFIEDSVSSVENRCFGIGGDPINDPIPHHQRDPDDDLESFSFEMADVTSSFPPTTRSVSEPAAMRPHPITMPQRPYSVGSSPSTFGIPLQPFSVTDHQQDMPMVQQQQHHFDPVTTSYPGKTPIEQAQLTQAMQTVKNLPVTCSMGPRLSTQIVTSNQAPVLYVSKQPQAEQTVLYKSDSANRGVLKDRDGNGFPTVEISNYPGPAEVRVFAATSTGLPHPYYFVQCVEGVGHCHEAKDHASGLPYAYMMVDIGSSTPGNCKAIFPRLSVKRFKDKEVLSHFAQWEHEKSVVYLKFVAVINNPRQGQVILETMSDPVKMNKKADKKMKGSPVPDGPPVISRTVGQWRMNTGTNEICIFGNNFAQDCHVYFTFFAIEENCELNRVKAVKAEDLSACTSTHLLVYVPQVGSLPFIPRSLAAKITVLNPSSKYGQSEYCLLHYQSS
eukprot:m.13401 g.13401  ORF g.13401 m.13401 type:complete len:534 (+) comp24776_c0_seq1:908-2509(+)